jgi:hypothetical protein
MKPFRRQTSRQPYEYNHDGGPCSHGSAYRGSEPASGKCDADLQLFLESLQVESTEFGTNGCKTSTKSTVDGVFESLQTDRFK